MSAIFPTDKRKRWRQQVLSSLELFVGTAFAVVLRALTRHSPRRSSAAVNLLIVGPSTRSVGDRAMFEAYCANFNGPLTIILPAPDAIDVSERSPDLGYVDLPNLIYSGFRNHVGDLWRFCQLAASANTVSIIGADVMDGRYDINASVRRFRVVYLAALAGAQPRVLGFSWNATPPKRVVKEMLRADRRAALLSRDPVSTRRLASHGAKHIEQVADLAFLTSPRALADGVSTDVEEFIGAARAAGRQILGLNINYLLEPHGSQVQTLAEVVPRLLARGVSVLLIPHDSRGTPSDIELLDRLHDELGGTAHVFRLGDTLDPRSVSWLAGQCDYVVTGRMHLAILSAVAGTPSLAMSYQGKIEGLYELLGLSFWLDPAEADATDLLAAIGRLAANAPEARAHLEDRLPTLRTAAMRNIPKV